MAIFHTSLKAFSRAKGQSAVASAAYRAGTVLVDERTGLKHDYSRKRGVERVEVLVPAAAPPWVRDIERLWNAAEAAEKRKNSCVARELLVALPHELCADRRTKLAEDIGGLLVSRYGVATMVAIHAPDARGDQRNHHAHILFTTRAMGPEGLVQKVRALDDREQGPREVERIRRAVAELTNAALAAAGHDERVDARSLRVQSRRAEDRGDYARAAMLAREPTEHVGPVETAAARRGEWSERVELNRVKQADREAALATFLQRAKAEGRLMPAASDTRPLPRRSERTRRSSARSSLMVPSVLAGPVRLSRAQGQDAELLNAEAALMEEGVRLAREESQAYLNKLKAAAEQYGAIVDAYCAEASQRFTREQLLAECAARPQCAELLARSTVARAELRTLRSVVPTARRRYGAAMARTAEARRGVDALDDQKPSAWRPLTRRQWAEKRRAQRAVLAGAEAVERRARAKVGEADTQSRQRAAELRAVVRRAEAERRQLRRGMARPAKHSHERTRVSLELSVGRAMSPQARHEVRPPRL